MKFNDNFLKYLRMYSDYLMNLSPVWKTKSLRMLICWMQASYLAPDLRHFWEVRCII